MLSLDDTIHLALANNTDIRIDQTAIYTAQNNVHRQYQLFDPIFNAGFNDQREKSQTSNELQGASILNNLSQTTQLGYAQTLPTGTNFQTNFIANKFSTNSGFFTLNPSFATSWQFQITQPLLKNFGTFPNKAPIYIAQRNLLQTLATFQGEVNDILFLVITQYWNVVLNRQAYEVQKKSFDEAQRSYEHDKKALSLGALPPLDIYRSESEVAARRVNVIQAEYALKQAEDLLRQLLAADRDSAINGLDLELTEKPEPSDTLMQMDIATAMSLALANRPELEAASQQLASDALNVRLAHNNLRPDLELGGFYTPTGLAGNQYSTAVPPVLLSTGGIGDSLNQMFGLKYPTYGAALTLRLPIKNHGAEADLADALGYATWRSISTCTHHADHKSGCDECRSPAGTIQIDLEAAKVARDLAQKSLQAEERKYQLGSHHGILCPGCANTARPGGIRSGKAQTGYQTAIAGIDHATGKLLERHQIKLVPAHN